MRTQELTPAEPSPGVGGRQAGLPDDLGHRCGRDAHTHTCQLADDPLVAPTWVLAGAVDRPPAYYDEHASDRTGRPAAILAVQCRRLTPSARSEKKR